MRWLTVLLFAAPVLAGDYKSQPGPHAVAVLETLELRGLRLRVTHPDSLRFGVQASAPAMRAWDKRPRQISLVLDSLAAIEKKIACRIDADRIGIGGHSFGAHTAQLLGGTTARGKSFAGRRVKCVLLLSPQGKGTLFREDSWKTLTKPALILTGSNDTGRNGQRPEWRLDPFKYSPQGDRYLVWIVGACGSTFTGTVKPWRRSRQTPPRASQTPWKPYPTTLCAQARACRGSRRAFGSRRRRSAG